MSSRASWPRVAVRWRGCSIYQENWGLGPLCFSGQQQRQRGLAAVVGHSKALAIGWNCFHPSPVKSLSKSRACTLTPPAPQNRDDFERVDRRAKQAIELDDDDAIEPCQLLA